jgi:pimeloyl-ACP methyl ester carboxylesterase
MSTAAPHYPYRSEADRDACFSLYDAKAAEEWPVASEERTVSTTHGRTFMRITGPADAPPLVLLPGALGTSLMWSPIIEALSAEYRTIAVDQMADLGRSVCDGPITRLEGLLAWLDELFDVLELRDGINLAGMSFGGWLAAEYGLHAPQRLARLVLMAPGGGIHRVGIEFIIRFGWAALRGPKTFPKLFRWIFPDMARENPGWIDDYIAWMLKAGKHLERRKLPLPGSWNDARLASLSVPALFVIGEHEVIYSPRKVLRRLARVAPQVKVDVIRGAGHDMTIVQADAVSGSVLEFLRAKTGAAKAAGA